VRGAAGGSRGSTAVGGAAGCSGLGAGASVGGRQRRSGPCHQPCGGCPLCHLRSALNHHVEAGSTIATPGCIRTRGASTSGPASWRAVTRPCPTTLIWRRRRRCEGARPVAHEEQSPQPCRGVRRTSQWTYRCRAGSQGFVIGAGLAGVLATVGAGPSPGGRGGPALTRPGQAAGGGRLRRGERRLCRPARDVIAPPSFRGTPVSDPRVHGAITPMNPDGHAPARRPPSGSEGAALGPLNSRWGQQLSACL